MEDTPGHLGLKDNETETMMNIKGRPVLLKYCEPIGNDDRIALILADASGQR